MIDVIRILSSKIFPLFKKSTLSSEVSEEEDVEIQNPDPRELPRPSRYIERNFEAIKIDEIENSYIPFCDCRNCLFLTVNVSECRICISPLQNRGVFSCHICGNITCWKCINKVKQCPFCRTELMGLRHRNLAIERLICSLELPCRNSRWGCDRNLLHCQREPHEKRCTFTPVGCPLKAVCGWNGKTTAIPLHLKERHAVSTLAGNTVTMKISNFRAKMVRSDRKLRRYTVSLACFTALFVCEVSLFKRKLNALFFKVAVNNESENNKGKECHGAWIQVSCGEEKLISGMVCITSIRQMNSQNFEVNCGYLSLGERDQIAIDIKIKQL